ncbi:class I SAM-dependent methyltransferase [Geodermatophilus sp. YIM 151500]|uniref:class I SAM-dependent methyltransferase n=1 Tax=Geodermatophilus sp. YIM 151500 TaxID=2984531 RepID=UPI0021E49BC1|nr:class I SAM-dependent methyltransferase [Geodermatophilus sp. YIM 151500]MCV2490829.1 class I SAM-dependent methyltransferase [Geodermatophilus sp. YIM 151500]
MCAPDWLALREAADAAARAPELADLVRDHLAAKVGPDAPAVIRDLGCGTGSMGRWLAPRLPGPQVWMLHDRDPGLLAAAAASMPRRAADGAPVTARTQEGDLSELRSSDLDGTALVTASALLDLLTAEEVDALAATCTEAGAAALLTLSFTGRVELAPADPLDAEFAAAFDAHQRRRTDDRRLLGPDAAAVAVDAFARRGAVVESRPSPWQLGADRAELAEEWLRAWIAAACAQRPDLRRCAGAYLGRKLDARRAGRLRLVVGHVDVLALPSGGGRLPPGSRTS